jgi:hypothetical protein
MRASILILVTGGLIAGLAASPGSSAPQNPPAPATPPSETTQPSPAQPAAAEPFDPRQAVAELEKAIADKREQPAETVFKNIQMFKGVPAVRILRIMDSGFSRSLGVTCTHCHDTARWESDDKPQKKIAREMMRMSQDINEKYLKSIAGLKSEKPTVNCTTCHRGQVKPALNLDESREGRPVPR